MRLLKGAPGASGLQKSSAMSGSTFKDSYTRFTLEETASVWRAGSPTGELRNGAGAAKTQITSDLKAYRRNTESCALCS